MGSGPERPFAAMAMDLMTRCPQCGTVFPASLDQLQLRKGYIRCVNCAHIFDGYEAVVPAAPPQSAPAPTPTPGPASAPGSGLTPSPALISEPRPASASASASGQASPPTVFSSVPPSPSRPAVSLTGAAVAPSVLRQRAPAGSALRLEPVVDATAYAQPSESSATAGRPEPRLYSDSDERDDSGPEISGIYAGPRDAGDNRPVAPHAGDAAPLPDFLRASRQRRRGAAGVFWGVLVLLGLALLAAQLTYVYRLQIAAGAPVLRPLLEQACGALGCTVAYSRRIERIAIMDSSLRATPRGKQLEPAENAMLLTVVLRNNYSRPQTWPTLMLDLVDFSGSVVVRRRLAPGDYLRADAMSGPFAAGAEMRITVPITVSNLQINGYQLGKYYPPEG